MNVYIWGIGRIAKKIYGILLRDPIGFIDSDEQKQKCEFCDCNVYAPQDVFEGNLPYPDIIIISAKSYKGIMHQMDRLHKGGKSIEVFSFWGEQELSKKVLAEIIDRQEWKIAVLEEKFRAMEERVSMRLANYGYEFADYMQKSGYWFPQVRGRNEAVERIVNDGCSLIRFGDGEFEIMAGKSRAPFQEYEKRLSLRLVEAVNAIHPKILIAIADNYGELSQYTDVTADGIRSYMTDDVRKFHASVLHPGRVYYDAYIFKTYLPYKDKSSVEQRINQIKRIWDKRDVVLIEGEFTRTGYGNDLLGNASSIARILCPTKNAWEKYENIFEESKKLDRKSLILIALGPAGKVLAYDLARIGFQAVDIGQADMDYDWKNAGVGYRMPNPYKYVSQLPSDKIREVKDATYSSQIIARLR